MQTMITDMLQYMEEISVCTSLYMSNQTVFFEQVREYIHVQTIITDMLQYMEEISDCTYTLLLQAFQPPFQSLTMQIEADVVC